MAGKLGRLAPEYPVGLGSLSHYFEGGKLPAAPKSVDYTAGVAVWPMYGNDTLGDCTCAAAGHMVQSWAQAAEGETETPADEDVLALYAAVGGSGDSGAVESQVLAVWHEKGLGPNKIVAYAPINHTDHTQWKSATAMFGGCYLGVQVPAVAMQQFDEGKPWDLTGTPADGDIVGGHAIPVLAYNDVRQIAEVITWGKIQQVTYRWLTQYLEEGWAIISEEVAAAGKFDGLQLEDLKSDLAKLKGAEGDRITAWTQDIPEAPVPEPEPGPDVTPRDDDPESDVEEDKPKETAAQRRAREKAERDAANTPS